MENKDYHNEDIQDYIDYLKYERKVSHNTYSSYFDNLKQIDLAYPHKKIINYTKEDIRDYLYKSDKSSKTKAHYLTVFRSFYDYLLLANKITKNPCSSIKLPKLEKKLPNYLTVEEVDKLLDIDCRNPLDYRNKAMLEVLYATGARISEVTTLKLSQIDFSECTIRIMGKGKKERIVPIADVARDYLELYLNNYRTFLVKKENDYVFLNKDGNPISRVGFFKILKNICQKAGIKKEVSPHTLRHSFATHLLNNGADLRIIQELLGHENLSTTEIYSHITNKKIEDDYQNHPRAQIEKGIK